MSQQCGGCQKDNYRVVFVAGTGQWLGAECGCLRIQILRDMDNPFSTSGELKLDHVFDGAGNKVRVTSLRELRQAESKFNFEHVASNNDRANWDKPKQQPAYQVSDHYQPKFPRGYEQ
jgi:hypothetical protein